MKKSKFKLFSQHREAYGEEHGKDCQTNPIILMLGKSCHTCLQIRLALSSDRGEGKRLTKRKRGRKIGAMNRYGNRIDFSENVGGQQTAVNGVNLPGKNGVRHAILQYSGVWENDSRIW